MNLLYATGIGAAYGIAVINTLFSDAGFGGKRHAGDAVIGGTLNRTGAFRFRATKVGKGTAVAQIIDLVEKAQASKAPIQKLAGWVAGHFLICPLVMLFMMRGMHGRGAHANEQHTGQGPRGMLAASEGPEVADLREQRDRLEARVEELVAQMSRLERAQETESRVPAPV
jgi:hypothetical protein